MQQALGRSAKLQLNRHKANAAPVRSVRRVTGRRAVLVRAEAAAGGDKVVCVGEALFGE